MLYTHIDFDIDNYRGFSLFNAICKDFIMYLRYFLYIYNAI